MIFKNLNSFLTLYNIYTNNKRFFSISVSKN